MEHAAEINRFAVFLFCLLVPLGSSAPTQISKEDKTTTGQRLNGFTTEINPLAWVIEKRATELFQYYNNCISGPLQGQDWLLDKPKAKDMVNKIPECPALQATCCALHHIHHTLQALRGDVEILCDASSRAVLDANIIQLRTTLRERHAFYTCSSQDLPQGHPSQLLPLGSADRMSYIWWFLKKYQEITQMTTRMHSERAVQYGGMERDWRAG